MRALILALGFGIAPLLGFDFAICQKYYKDASIPVGDSRAILVEHKKEKVFLAFFRQKPKNANIIKADPFIGLYLIKGDKKSKQSYMLMPITQKAFELNMAMIGPNGVKRGIILEAQKGFLEYGRFTAPVQTNGIISNICYQIYGIGIEGNRFVDSRYIDRFLGQDTPYYGDIGVRLYHDKNDINTLRVEFVNPFFSNVPFLRNDIILSINDQAFTNIYDFEWFVANLKQYSKIKVKIKRDNEILTFPIEVGRRYGGFLLPDTFFESIGIQLDAQLKVTSLNQEFYALQQGLLEGDVLLWINQHKILTENTKTLQQVQERIRFLLTQAVQTGKLDILISRNGFQFTLNLISGLNNDYIKNRYNPFGF
ncbi:hypothetical protein BBW65_00285 [Helicobacter enhydrae]|uniref:Uncharacterized protein n=1 Tax=Helicobacter enhydrae TaxID=222136 RepID=A0A1B1U3M4_9HELI|nr:PDZ domain-containing protein [Helicobacter enhydrae]ANV97351.1 hypothetical protein BBW65_00285 [Helicobacter enhydrae]